MYDLAPKTRPLVESPLVRHRCLPCEVAWSGPSGTPCWVCGGDGVGLRAVVRRIDDELFELDFAGRT